jgi:hypothetical protein
MRGNLIGLMTLGLLASACNNLLDVKVPSRILATSLEDPVNAQLVVDGAVSDLECALSSYVMAYGLITDELDDAALSQAQFDFDRRTFTAAGGAYATGGCGTTAVTVPVSTARFTTDHALTLLDGWTDAQVPNRKRLIATAAAYAGFSYILLGEGQCTAAVDGGPELTPAQIFALAEQRFDRAITEAPGIPDNNLLNMARIGRARARLNMGKTTEAVQDAQLVPNGFVFNARYNDANGRARNGVYQALFRGNGTTVGPAFRGLTFDGVVDTRTLVVNTNLRAFDQVNFIWTATKYNLPTSPIALAKWQEAQLIIAEVQGGATAVNIINALHTAAGIPATFASSDPVAIMAQVVEERRREFFLDGHRGYDINRLGLAQNPPAGTAYPKGGFYGDMKCLPLPDVERNNNPTLKGH